MNYPPKIHQDNNQPHIIEVIKQYPLATVISIKDNQPFITHLPLVFKGDKLIGHIDAQNPQASLLKNNNSITVIFSGPQCYISPSIYNSEQLPTWNYIKVHLKGTVSEIKDPEAIKQSMIAMTEFLEQPNHTYRLDPDNTSMQKYLPYVKGFEVTITHWEGKFKLSQNRTKEDFELAKKHMIIKNQESIKTFLDTIL